MALPFGQNSEIGNDTEKARRQPMNAVAGARTQKIIPIPERMNAVGGHERGERTSVCPTENLDAN